MKKEILIDLMDLDEHLAGSGDRHGNLPQLQTGACFGLHDGVHVLFHSGFLRW